MKLFQRRWRVQVGSLETTDLNIRFTVKRTLAARPGTLDLEIYNLRESHRAELASTARGALVQLEAGHVEGMSVLFRGDLRKCLNSRSGTTWTTRITAGDGEHAVRSARVARGFGPNTTVGEVVRAIADAMGVGVGNALSSLSGASFDGADDGIFHDGVVVHGAAFASLSRIAESAGFQVSVQEGLLQLLPRGGALNRTAVRLSPETGLIGPPEPGRGPHAKAKALIQPDLVPGRLVELASETLNGMFRIESAETTGESKGGDWYAALALRRQ